MDRWMVVWMMNQYGYNVESNDKSDDDNDNDDADHDVMPMPKMTLLLQ